MTTIWSPRYRRWYRAPASWTSGSTRSTMHLWLAWIDLFGWLGHRMSGDDWWAEVTE